MTRQLWLIVSWRDNSLDTFESPFVIWKTSMVIRSTVLSSRNPRTYQHRAVSNRLPDEEPKGVHARSQERQESHSCQEFDHNQEFRHTAVTGEHCYRMFDLKSQKKIYFHSQNTNFSNAGSRSTVGFSIWYGLSSHQIELIRMAKRRFTASTPNQTSYEATVCCWISIWKRSQLVSNSCLTKDWILRLRNKYKTTFTECDKHGLRPTPNVARRRKEDIRGRW